MLLRYGGLYGKVEGRGDTGYFHKLWGLEGRIHKNFPLGVKRIKEISKEFFEKAKDEEVLEACKRNIRRVDAKFVR